MADLATLSQGELQGAALELRAISDRVGERLQRSGADILAIGRDLIRARGVTRTWPLRPVDEAGLT